MLKFNLLTIATLASLAFFSCDNSQTGAPVKPVVKEMTSVNEAKIADTGASTSKETSKNTARFAFYNVENLFDTKDNPDRKDEQFLPTSEKEWTVERYQKKLENIYQVLEAMGDGDVPAIIGVSEVENKQVMLDLIEKTPMRNMAYSVVHEDSKDVRGIDVGLMYNTKLFKHLNHKAIFVELPERFQDEPSRDILYTRGKWLPTDEILHIFINHWSSRRKGQELTEPKRMACARTARKEIDKILEKDKDAKIILMGDFNDEPRNNSLVKGLQASLHPEKPEPSKLYNLSFDHEKAGRGTYNFRGDWNMLDQVVVSSSLLTDRDGLHTSNEDDGIFKADFMIYMDKKYGEKPSKTYGGPRYFGGYSDHYPVYVDVHF